MPADKDGGDGVGLTRKQKAFIAAYAGNATEAAIKAGYSRKSAYSTGQENLKKPEIQKAIQGREDKYLNKLISTREERLICLTEIMRDREEATKDRLKAIDTLCRMNGDYLERVGTTQKEPVIFQWQS